MPRTPQFQEGLGRGGCPLRCIPGHTERARDADGREHEDHDEAGEKDIHVSTLPSPTQTAEPLRFPAYRLRNHLSGRDPQT
jgi:hypothetical protein